MSCTRFNQTVASSCRNSQPGIKNLYVANFDSVSGYTTDAGGDILTGITPSSTAKCFYKIALNKQVGVIADVGSINIQNGTALCKPSVTFKTQGFSTAVRKIYEQLLQATVIVAFETIDGTLYIMGLENGMDATELAYGTESDPAGFKGLAVKLEGTEPVPFYEIGDINFLATYVV
jgi:hypothetical protein